MRRAKERWVVCAAVCQWLLALTVSSTAQLAPAINDGTNPDKDSSFIGKGASGSTDPRKGGGNSTDDEPLEVTMLPGYESSVGISPWQALGGPWGRVQWVDASSRRVLVYDGKAAFESRDNSDTWLTLSRGPDREPDRRVISNVDGFAFELREGNLIATDEKAGAEAQGSGMHPEATVICVVQIDATFFAATDQGVYASTDRGATWQLASEPYPAMLGNRGQKNMRIEGMAAKESMLFALSDGKVFKSTDHARNWQPVQDGISDRYAITCLRDIDGRLIAGSRGMGVYISDDGETWKAVGPPGPSNCFHVGCLPESDIAAIEIMGSHLFAVTRQGGVFHSRRRGSSWRFYKRALPVGCRIVGISAWGGYAYAWDKDGRAFRLKEL